MADDTNGGRFATQKDLREAEGRIIKAVADLRESVVSRETCDANHRFLDVGKLWLIIGVVGILQLLIFAQLAAAN